MKKARQKPWTPERLERAAYHYLSRYASNRARLAEVLERKIRRAKDWGELSEEEARWIAELTDKCEKMDLIDDAAFAAAKARSMHRSGKSVRAVRAWLKGRGVDAEHIEAALADLAEDKGLGDAVAIDTVAALRFARKRRLGPFRRKPLPTGAEGLKAREKELAALARAGFAFGVAREIVEAEDEDDLQTRLDRIAERRVID